MNGVFMTVNLMAAQDVNLCLNFNKISSGY